MFCRRGQTTLEYGVMVVAVGATAIAIAVLAKRHMERKHHQSITTIGSTPFTAGKHSSDYQTWYNSGFKTTYTDETGASVTYSDPGQYETSDRTEGEEHDTGKHAEEKLWD